MRKTLALVLVVGGLYTSPLKSECIECKNLIRELNLERKHSMDLAKEVRALVKDLLSYSKEIRKYNGTY